MKQNLILTQLQELIEKEERPFTFQEACSHLDISPSYLYKLTSQNKIVHFKPNGKKIYFQKSDLNAWLLRNRVSTADELEQQAIDYVTLGVK